MLVVLISFNGEKHAREAENLRKSMELHDPASLENLVVTDNDSFSREFAAKWNLPTIVMPETDATGTHSTPNFNRACRRKVEVILKILETGKSVSYTDTDVVYLGPVMDRILRTMDEQPSYNFFAQQ